MKDLSEQDPDFHRWWATHHVAARTTGTKTVNHPIAGTLVLEWDTLTATTDPDQQLIIWTATPDTSTEEGPPSLVIRSTRSAPDRHGRGQAWSQAPPPDPREPSADEGLAPCHKRAQHLARFLVRGEEHCALHTSG